jgi:hypothetical protein
MRYRFEFNPENKILLLRFEGRRLTNELVTELDWGVRTYSTATDASAGIWDLSAVTEFAVSPELSRDLSNREPAMPEATRRPHFPLAPTHGWTCYPPLQAFGGVRASKPAPQGTRKFAPRGSRTENWPSRVNE